jgi:hypothetical protein
MSHLTIQHLGHPLMFLPCNDEVCMYQLDGHVTNELHDVSCYQTILDTGCGETHATSREIRTLFGQMCHTT